MTTIATRTRQISDLEGFDVIFMKEGKPVNTDKNGEPKYDFDKKTKGSMTVSSWKATRFKSIYKGYECEVLYGNGSHANGNALLSTVRASYEEDEEI